MKGLETELTAKIRRGTDRKFAYYASVLAAAAVSFGVYFLFSAPARLPDSTTQGQSALSDLSELNGHPSPQIRFDPATLPAFDVAETIEFGLDKDNRPYGANSALLSGWSVPEPGGIWSLGKDAAIGFVVRCADNTCPGNFGTLSFEGIAFVVPGHNIERIEVRTDNKPVDQVTLSTYFAKFTIALNGLTIKDGTQLVLSVYLPDAIVPGAVSTSNDPREVGFRIKSLRLE